MPTQQSRDEKTVAIATALGIFVLFLALAFVFLWAMTSAFDLSDEKTSQLFDLLVGASALPAVVYLVRLAKR